LNALDQVCEGHWRLAVQGNWEIFISFHSHSLIHSYFCPRLSFLECECLLGKDMWSHCTDYSGVRSSEVPWLADEIHFQPGW
jgi:hypothetical protein